MSSNKRIPNEHPLLCILARQRSVFEPSGLPRLGPHVATFGFRFRAEDGSMVDARRTFDDLLDGLLDDAATSFVLDHLEFHRRDASLFDAINQRRDAERAAPAFGVRECDADGIVAEEINEGDDTEGVFAPDDDPRLPHRACIVAVSTGADRRAVQISRLCARK